MSRGTRHLRFVFKKRGPLRSSTNQGPTKKESSDLWIPDKERTRPIIFQKLQIGRRLFKIQEHPRKNRSPGNQKSLEENSSNARKMQDQRQAVRIQSTPRPDNRRVASTGSQPVQHTKKPSCQIIKILQGDHQLSKHFISRSTATRRHISGGSAESCQDTSPLGDTSGGHQLSR